MVRIAPVCGAFLSAILCLMWALPAAGAVFHVATTGKDTNDGTAAKPFATLGRAQKAVRQKVAAGLKGDVRVLIHGGVYRLEAPLRFGPGEAGTDAFEVIYTAAGEQKVVLSGGRPIRGWKKAGGKLWTTVLAEVKAGKWYFRQLFVNGRRATRARTPNADDKSPYVRLADAKQSSDKKTYQLRLAPGLVRNWRNVEDVEIVIHGNWAINRKRFQSVDPKAGLITLAPPHAAAIPWNRPTRGRNCYLENAIEMLDRPGEWYLDRKTGVLTYWPREGEDMGEAEAVAPVLTGLVEVVGTDKAPVRNLHFRGVHFEHVAWPLPAGGYHGIQACHYITAGKQRRRPWPGIKPAIYCEHAQRVSFTDGGIAHLGGSGIFLGRGCKACEIRGNHVHDVAANGVMISGPNDEKLTPKDCRIANNYVHATGAEYFGACAIWVGFAEGAAIVHNRVHDVPYTGISVGWQWNPQPTACKRNLLENNHVYDVMKLLADGGCIYTLGYQPGTVLRGNLLHQVHRSPYTHGGAPNNGIFIDQGSKGYLFERNVIYDTHGGPIRFNQCRREWHTWKDNVLNPPAGKPNPIVQQVRAAAGLQPEYRKKLLGKP